jgi:hypothetical protein
MFFPIRHFRSHFCPTVVLSAIAVLFSLWSRAAGDADAPSGRQAWQEASLGLFNSAHRAFAAEAPSSREARFGEAITLLNVQPKTNANLNRAAALFDELADSVPASGADDIAISARYFLARIPQVHRSPPVPVEARRRFEQLIAATGGLDGNVSVHPLAQRALVEIAIIDLYSAALPENDLRVRITALAARGAALTDTDARRDLHFTLGDAALRFRLGDELALEHLLAADAAGFSRLTVQASTWVCIAGIAHRTGRHDVAVTYYTKFLDTFVRDSRRRLVEERLATLALSGSPGSSGSSGSSGASLSPSAPGGSAQQL